MIQKASIRPLIVDRLHLFGNIVFLFKSKAGLKCFVSNFRRISKLLSILKLFEKLLDPQLYQDN